MKLTAVEWLINEMHKKEQGLIETSYNHIFDLAKEMEKEQSQEYAEFAIQCYRFGMKVINFEDWTKLEIFK